MSIAVGCSQLDVSYPGTVRASHYEDYSSGFVLQVVVQALIYGSRIQSARPL